MTPILKVSAQGRREDELHAQMSFEAFKLAILQAANTAELQELGLDNFRALHGKTEACGDILQFSLTVCFLDTEETEAIKECEILQALMTTGVSLRIFEAIQPKYFGESVQCF